jgi:uncharacterized membrane protein
MKRVGEYIIASLAAGLLIVVPIYLSFLLLFKAMQAVGIVVRPLAKLLPEWFPAEQLFSFFLVVLVCFVLGAIVQTSRGQAIRERMEKSILERLPGYALFRSLTQQLEGKGEENVWKPALAEIEEALVPAFIIEEFDDGRFTVFVPSAPTPISGSIYILTPERVHPLDIPFTRAVKSLSRWGSGSKELVAAMRPETKPRPRDVA